MMDKIMSNSKEEEPELIRNPKRTGSRRPENIFKLKVSVGG